MLGYVNMDPQIVRLAQVVRENTLKLLRDVPIGSENWRVDPEAMSFADTAQHLLDADSAHFEALRTSVFSPRLGYARLLTVADRREFDAVIEQLRESGQRRVAMMEELGDQNLYAPISAPWGTITTWWLIARVGLDHEANHRGQIAAYLRALRSKIGPVPGTASESK